MIKSEELRKKFLEFFKEKKHKIISSASLVPQNDPTVLFNTAGMQPLVPFLLGEKHPEGKRIANFQKCLRTNDLEEVGDDTHLTFFEMLGNWSLGDYFKEESIAWSFEFLTSEKWLNLDKKMIAVTVFQGDKNSEKDEKSAKIWEEIGMPKDRISFLPKSENWWGPAGETGPCGPDTEIFYWIGKSEFPPKNSNVENDEENWMEIWNNVFMEFIKNKDGKFEKAKQQNVDTGMGLERIITTLNGKKNIYETDIFEEVLNKIGEKCGINYFSLINFCEKNKEKIEINKIINSKLIKSFRIIADHTRTSIFLISDGVIPGNVDQSYILRRLMRRAILQMQKLGAENQEELFLEIAKITIKKYSPFYSNLEGKEEEIFSEIKKEVNQFQKTLVDGKKEFQKLLKGFEMAFEKTGRKITEISGKQAFKLYDTYGLPIDVSKDLAEENNLTVDEKGFEEAFKKHQELSRKGSENKFKGGLADDSEICSAYHTATHLLHQALKNTLGENVEQKGSNITSERMRFDFSYGEKMSDEQKKEVENAINKEIKNGLEISFTEMSVEEAKNQGAIGLFEAKYGEKIKVYSMGNYSKEICGGPHMKNTGEIFEKFGLFKIKKEGASSAGVRRIRGIFVK